MTSRQQVATGMRRTPQRKERCSDAGIGSADQVDTTERPNLGGKWPSIRGPNRLCVEHDNRDPGIIRAMSEPPQTMERLARRVRIALEAQDLVTFNELLDPGVTWGAPGARNPSCKNRQQVIAWYQRGRESGGQAQVNDVSVVGDRLIVGLTVRRTDAANQRGGAALRWQVLTVRDGLVVEIVGFDDRIEAFDHAAAGTGQT
jgi:ketosteroid isomerase-like protein